MKTTFAHHMFYTHLCWVWTIFKVAQYMEKCSAASLSSSPLLVFLPPLSFPFKIFNYHAWRVRSNTGSRADWFYSDIDGRVWPIAAAQGFAQLLLWVCVCVCLIVPDHGFPGFPLTSWPLYPVRRVNAAFNQFYRLTHTHTANAADPVHPCSVKHASLRFNWSPAHTPLSQPLSGTHLILPALLTPPT